MGEEELTELIREAVAILQASRYGVAFTGAGISVESGIPPFQGENGLWSRYDPIFLDIEFFRRKPAASWKKIKEIFYETLSKAEPNGAHYFLSILQKRGILESIITLNIDSLHQMAGSKNVLQLHGSIKKLICMECASEYDISFTDLNFLPPTCYICKGLLKPAIVFFNEPLPKHTVEQCFEEVRKADVLLIIGTDGEAFPASQIPMMAKDNGASIIEINIRKSHFSDTFTDVFLEGPAVEITRQMGKLMLINES
jgi:NAD-dependent deacetylase